jgi:hypothetical protein
MDLLAEINIPFKQYLLNGLLNSANPHVLLAASFFKLKGVARAMR